MARLEKEYEVTGRALLFSELRVHLSGDKGLIQHAEIAWIDETDVICTLFQPVGIDSHWNGACAKEVAIGSDVRQRLVPCLRIASVAIRTPQPYRL